MDVKLMMMMMMMIMICSWKTLEKGNKNFIVSTHYLIEIETKKYPINKSIL